MCQSSSTIRLNDVVHIVIQSKGMEYVSDNYIEIREDYYNKKEQELPSEKGDQ